MSISKMHPKCDKCKHKDDCNNKRMMACAVMELPLDMGVEIRAPITENASMPVAKEYTPITINMGEYGTISTSREELKKQLKESFYKCVWGEQRW